MTTEDTKITEALGAEGPAQRCLRRLIDGRAEIQRLRVKAARIERILSALSEGQEGVGS